MNQSKKDVKTKFFIVHQTLADVTKMLSDSYVSAIREYSHKQRNAVALDDEAAADISYGYAMGYYSALNQLEGLRESQYSKRSGELSRAGEMTP